jgi:mevalonate kinase
VYCGYKTPTPTVIAHVQQAWQAAPVLLQQQYAWMGEITQQAVVAIQQQDLQLLGRYMNIAHGLLHGLGVSDAALDAIVHRLRATQGIIGAKISGSGLGDCVIGLGTADIAIEDALILEITPNSAHVQELR